MRLEMFMWRNENPCLNINSKRHRTEFYWVFFFLYYFLQKAIPSNTQSRTIGWLEYPTRQIWWYCSAPRPSHGSVFPCVFWHFVIASIFTVFLLHVRNLLSIRYTCNLAFSFIPFACKFVNRACVLWVLLSWNNDLFIKSSISRETFRIL